MLFWQKKRETFAISLRFMGKVHESLQYWFRLRLSGAYVDATLAYADWVVGGGVGSGLQIQSIPTVPCYIRWPRFTNTAEDCLYGTTVMTVANPHASWNQYANGSGCRLISRLAL